MVDRFASARRFQLVLSLILMKLALALNRVSGKRPFLKVTALF
ncbi:hypothetical protein BLL52_4106 [Rhodoferax antarcticus ANT.BR]|uniref:Uncharacterized protein n=1 Tax=Rhodoferax antarcticus ANT.BR TaxID=1111071 RepID=A0A1Q8Y8T0_9BURK|nr:hypothetical protein BLL52_4106 [Rhodoferax antarcticus ANT.BR]